MKQQGNKNPSVRKQPLPAMPPTPQVPPAPPRAPARQAVVNSTTGPTGPLPSREVPAAGPSRQARFRPGDWILVPLRLFLGVTFVYAGIQKFTDPQFFNPKAAGYIGKQIISFAHGSPIQGILLHLALPHAMLFGAAIALGEIAIGLGALFGFLLRPAAFFGFLLSLMFFLSASFHVFPYFYGSDIVFVFAWITLMLAGPLRTGLPTLDGRLVPGLLSTLSPEVQVPLGRATSFLLGVGNQNAPVFERASAPLDQPGRVAGNPGMAYQQRTMQPQQQMSYKARIAAQRRSMDNRRNFLLGMLAGGLGMLGITLVGRVIHGGDDSAAGTQTGTTGTSGGGTTSGSTSGTATTGTPGASNAIAQVSAVPPNSAVSFTIPSNGDPGILVHLNNGKFACYDATCTHAGCPVQFDSGSSLLICPCHGAEFDPANNASVVQGPAQTPLTGVPINVNNTTGAITLQ